MTVTITQSCGGSEGGRIEAMRGYVLRGYYEMWMNCDET